MYISAILSLLLMRLEEDVGTELYPHTSCSDLEPQLERVCIHVQRMKPQTWRSSECLNYLNIRLKRGQVIEEYYLHWTTTFEIYFSGSSDTNHGSLL
jgi:hypothetical protein